MSTKDLSLVEAHLAEAKGLSAPLVPEQVSYPITDTVDFALTQEGIQVIWDNKIQYDGEYPWQNPHAYDPNTPRINQGTYISPVLTSGEEIRAWMTHMKAEHPEAQP